MAAAATAPSMEEYLTRAKQLMSWKEYRKAILTLQKARDACSCNELFRQENTTKCHSSMRSCLLESILAASTSDDRDAIYKAATGPCKCGTRKLSCDREAHVDVLDKMSACSEAIGKFNAALCLAAAAVDLAPQSPVGYCRLSKLLRSGAKSQEPVLDGRSNEDVTLGVVWQGLHNIKKHGCARHPLIKVLQIIYKKVSRSDPLVWFPTELKVVICSHLDTVDLFRCMRVSKGWLTAIRDDPDVWKNIYLPLTRNRLCKKKRASGLLRLIPRIPKVYSLALGEIAIPDRSYLRILRALPDLRHLHLEVTEDHGSPDLDIAYWSFNSDWAGFQSKLTRLTINMRDLNSDPMYRQIVSSCASTLEELQLLGTRIYPLRHPALIVDLPRLRVLRINTQSNIVSSIVYMSALCRATPNLEQLCLDGPQELVFDPDSNERWLKLKVFILGLETIVRGWFARFLPQGIRVIEIWSDSQVFVQPDSSHMPDFKSDALDWTELEHFRLKSPIMLDGLSRMIKPSLESGTLKTLHLGDPTWEEGQDPTCLPLKSDHVQVFGFDGLIGRVWHSLGFMGVLADAFPNWHTLSLCSGRDTLPTSLFDHLFQRPQTKRIFQNSLMGIRRDEVKQIAQHRGASLWDTDFPIYFPWHFDDGDQGEGGKEEGGEVKDVVEQWKLNRGRVFSGQASAVSQPFFRE